MIEVLNMIEKFLLLEEEYYDFNRNQKRLFNEILESIYKLRKEFEMTEAKKKMLEAKGSKVTDSADWLGLSKEEAQLVDMRVALAQELERVRKAKGITQAELARRVGTKQSGVARMLNNPDTTTMDNLIKSLIALGEPISKIAACLLLCTNAN